MDADEKDLTQRLRDMNRMAFDDVMNEAADEIEQLRDHVEELRAACEAAKNTLFYVGMPREKAIAVCVAALAHTKSEDTATDAELRDWEMCDRADKERKDRP